MQTTVEINEKHMISTPFGMLPPICKIAKGVENPFYDGLEEESLRNLLGGKGLGLYREMRRGRNVPESFTIPIPYCEAADQHGDDFLSWLYGYVKEAIDWLQTTTGKAFGDQYSPLFTSCRSGAYASMPGMMDTILNLGINREMVNTLLRQANDLVDDEATKLNKKKWVVDSYLNLMAQFCKIAKGQHKTEFEHAEEAFKQQYGVEKVIDGPLEALLALMHTYEAIATSFEQSWEVQINDSIAAVFNSFNNERAKDYRRNNHLQHLKGTAVNICTMVFGNLNEKSGTMVVFSRNIITGADEIFGVYVPMGQGDKAVDGSTKTQPISYLRDLMPDAYASVVEQAQGLEKDNRYPQDIEMTVENGIVYVLQTRDIKPSGPAAVLIANAYFNANCATKKQLLAKRISATNLMQCISSRIDTDIPENEKTVIGKGTATSYGAGSGVAVFTKVDALECKDKGQPFIFISKMTTPDDFSDCMLPSKGVITTDGGPGCHAAINTVKDGIPCITDFVGSVDLVNKQLLLNGEIVIKSGDLITIDGGAGICYVGALKLVEPNYDEENFKNIMEWIGEHQSLPVRMNAEVGRQIKIGHRLGGVGIGLMRAEDFIMNSDEMLTLFRLYVLEDNTTQKGVYLSELEIKMKESFIHSLELLNGQDVNLRYLDPPVGEFFEASEDTLAGLCTTLNITRDELQKKIAAMHEVNTMMGFRGVRLGIVHPMLTMITTRAFLGAAVELKGKGIVCRPELMVPLVSTEEELIHQIGYIKQAANELFISVNDEIAYKLYVMIETPAAAIIAGALAKHVDGFSFGTNDLTQFTLGVSRDDAYKFMQTYLKGGTYLYDPFVTIEKKAVLPLIVYAIMEGKKTNPNLVCGICGEHGGDPESIRMFIAAGGNYVSCSSKRVAGARLTMAQIAIQASQN